MKKVLVILLILAVSAGAFAQGEWSVSAFGQLTTVIDGGPAPSVTENGSTIHNKGWGYGSNEAWGKIAYNNGTWDGFIQLNYAGEGNAMQTGVTGNGDNFKFYVGGNIFDLGAGNVVGLGDLWGWYKWNPSFASIQVQVSYAGGDLEWMWGDSGVLGDPFANGRGSADGPDGEPKGGKITANFTIDALQIGFILPNVFNTSYNFIEEIDDPANPGTMIPNPDFNPHPDFIMDAIRNMTFGVKYGTDDFSAGFNLGLRGENLTKVYAGLTLKMLSPITVEVAFKGSFYSNVATNGLKSNIRIGPQVQYSAGDFGARVRADISISSYDGGDSASNIQITPRLWYKIIPESLYFELEANIGFAKARGASDSSSTFSIRPILTYNFNNNGASRWEDWQRDFPAMYLQYNLGFSTPAGSSDSTLTDNRATIGFKWRI